MRAVVVVLVFLGLCTLAMTVSAQPRHESIIIMFNDTACTHHLRTERVPEPSSTKCEPEEFRTHNMSTVFECDSTNNVTHLIQQVYNNTLKCDNTPVVSVTSAAAAHSCAPISVTYEGQKALVYGHIECAPPNMTSSYDDFLGLRNAAAASVARQAEAAQAEAQVGVFQRFLNKLFA